MQGKIALEEHFATEATLGDSQVFGAACLGHAAARACSTSRTCACSEMDKHGVEMMILSLNAPAVQAIHDVKRAIAVAREANDILAENVRKRPDRFAVSPRCRCRTRKRPPPSSTRCVKELGFVGALVNGFSQIGTPDNVALLRPAAIPAVLERGRGARRAVLSASAQSAAELEPQLRGPPLAARAELGVRCRDRGACAAADRQRTVRRMPETEDRARPYRRRHSGASCGASTAATAG